MQGATQLSKSQQAEIVARIIKEASLTISRALDKLQEYDLNLENYPKGWLDFNEHPMELNNIIVNSPDDDSVHVKVGETF